jgi:hypothetical protein
MVNNDKGLEKETEVSNFFSSQGYFTRPHVQLYPKEGQISDIDVLCIRFDNQLVEQRTIIEVKSSNDSYSTIFQLYGLKTYFGNCDAFFVCDKIGLNTLKITKELGIKVFSFKTLNKIAEKDMKLKSIELKPAHLLKIHDLFLKKVKSINSNLFWGYNDIWLERNPYLKLYKIQGLFKLTEDVFQDNAGDESFLWFRKELFMLSLVSVYEIASDCIELDPKLIDEYLEEKYYNLGIPRDKKMQLKEGIDKLVSLFEEREGIHLDITFEIIPKWIPILSGCVKKIISTSKYAQKNLLLNERIFKSFLIEDPKSIEEITNNRTRLDIVTKLNTEVLKILHNQQIKPDFEFFI